MEKRAPLSERVKNRAPKNWQKRELLFFMIKTVWVLACTDLWSVFKGLLFDRKTEIDIYILF